MRTIRWVSLVLLMPVLGWAREYSFRSFGNADGLTNLAVRQIYEDRVGFLWVSTENGIFRYDGERFEAFGPEQGIPLNSAAAFGEAPDGSLLVGGNIGLYHLRGNRFEKLGLPFKSVNWAQGIQADGKGHTYLGTDAGLMELSADTSGGGFHMRPLARAEATSAPEVYGVFVDGDVIWYTLKLFHREIHIVKCPPRKRSHIPLSLGGRKSILDGDNTKGITVRRTGPRNLPTGSRGTRSQWNLERGEGGVRIQNPHSVVFLLVVLVPLCVHARYADRRWRSFEDVALEAACTQMSAWTKNPRTAHLTLAVNISARQLLNSRFTQDVLAVLERTGADPNNLELELTESMFVDKVEDVVSRMTELKSHGLRFSLDDFGTGYSSLAYLRRLPLDQLKIDQAFVRDLLTDTSSSAIAQSIIALGKAMGLSVIAEGVETEEQKEFLARLGCHAFQGYLFSEPLPLAEFEQLLSVKTRSATASRS
ncbi:MAG TPA: EAL domain-containing protein [Terriglobales bacterium]|nr:EAL domain-containing protein [Terriglobales bacterium]